MLMITTIEHRHVRVLVFLTRKLYACFYTYVIRRCPLGVTHANLKRNIIGHDWYKIFFWKCLHTFKYVDSIKQACLNKLWGLSTLLSRKCKTIWLSFLVLVALNTLCTRNCAPHRHFQSCEWNNKSIYNNISSFYHVLFDISYVLDL